VFFLFFLLPQERENAGFILLFSGLPIDPVCKQLLPDFGRDFLSIYRGFFTQRIRPLLSTTPQENLWRLQMRNSQQNRPVANGVVVGEFSEQYRCHTAAIQTSQEYRLLRLKKIT
jgi:hypothetical protein